MSNPALKNGYFSIANELAEQFALNPIPSSEMRLIWVVFRKTWSWGEGSRKKDWDKISLSQFEKYTGMKHTNVATSLKALVVKRLLLKSDKGYCFNQNYEEWVVVKRLPPVVNRLPSSQTTTESSSQTTTKSSSQTTTNKRNKKGLKKDQPAPQSVAPFIVEVIDAFKPVNSAYQKWFPRPPMRDACSRLVEQHGLDTVLRVIKMLHVSNGIPYFPTITTPLQLEDKWAQLESAWRKERAKNTSKTTKII